MTLYLYYPDWSNGSMVVYTNSPTCNELKHNTSEYYAVAIPLKKDHLHFYYRWPHGGKWKQDVFVDKYGMLQAAAEKILELVNAFPD